MIASLTGHDDWQVVFKTCGFMWRTEQRMEISLWVDDNDDGRVIYRIVTIIDTGFLKEYAEPVGQLAYFCKLAGYTDDAGAEITDVLTNDCWCVAFRIDTNENNPRQLLRTGIQHLLSCVGQYLQRQWTYVGAIRETKEHEIPVVAETGARKRIAVLIQ